MAAPDRYTALSAATGAIVALRGHPFGTALAIAVFVEAAVQVSCRYRPSMFADGTQSPWTKSAIDVVGAMAGWGAVRSLAPRAIPPAGALPRPR